MPFGKEKARAEKNRRAYILFSTVELLRKSGDDDAAHAIYYLANAALRDKQLWDDLTDVLIVEVSGVDMSDWDEWRGP